MYIIILLKNSLRRVQDRPLNGFFSTIFFLLVSLFPTVERTKKAATPTLGLFIKHKLNLLFRLIIYEENIDNLHCINK